MYVDTTVKMYVSHGLSGRAVVGPIGHSDPSRGSGVYRSGAPLVTTISGGRRDLGRTTTTYPDGSGRPGPHHTGLQPSRVPGRRGVTP